MRIRPIDIVDVFAYLVVLGVFIQLFPYILSESFLLALLTSILLKVVLEAVLWLKKNIKGRIKATERRGVRVINVVAMFLVLPGSKFIIIELVALIFGDAVKLGNFFQVTALIVVLTLARAGVRRLFQHGGKKMQVAA